MADGGRDSEFVTLPDVGRIRRATLRQIDSAPENRESGSVASAIPVARLPLRRATQQRGGGVCDPAARVPDQHSPPLHSGPSEVYVLNLRSRGNMQERLACEGLAREAMRLPPPSWSPSHREVGSFASGGSLHIGRNGGGGSGRDQLLGESASAFNIPDDMLGMSHLGRRQLRQREETFAGQGNSAGEMDDQLAAPGRPLQPLTSLVRTAGAHTSVAVLASNRRRTAAAAGPLPMTRTSQIGTTRGSRAGRSEQQLITISGVGTFPRRQLQNLEHVLNGRPGASQNDLPDLQSLNEAQLIVLDDAISGGILAEAESPGDESPISADDDVTIAQAVSVGQGPWFHHSTSSSPRRQGSNNIVGDRSSGKKWKIDEAAMSRLVVTAGAVLQNLECSICYQEVQKDAVVLPCHQHGCGSVFHGGCIRPWLERKPNCPLCRDDLKELVTLAPVPTDHGDGLPILLELWMHALADDIGLRQIAAPHRRSVRDPWAAFRNHGGHSRGSHGEGSLSGLQGMVLPAFALAQLLRDAGALSSTSESGGSSGPSRSMHGNTLGRRSVSSGSVHSRGPDASGAIARPPPPAGNQMPQPRQPSRSSHPVEHVPLGTRAPAEHRLEASHAGGVSNRAQVAVSVQHGTASALRSSADMPTMRRALAAALGRSASLPQLPS